MRFPYFAAASLAIVANTNGQGMSNELFIEINGDPSLHELTFQSRVGYTYSVENSFDLENWMTTLTSGEPGTGMGITFAFMSPSAPKNFYRVIESPMGLIFRPSPGETVPLQSGVCFAFNLDCLTELPDRIEVSTRPGSGGAWTRRGLITDVEEISGTKLVRGPVVWVPDTAGSYEVQAVAKNAAGGVLESSIVPFSVATNHPPSVTIVSSDVVEGNTVFETALSDSELDTIRRVEFYDDGVLMGVDRTQPFGDTIQDLEGVSYRLLGGNHLITARAFDGVAGAGPVSSPFSVNVTSGNAAPNLTLTVPSEIIVDAGDTFDVSFEATDPDGVNTIDFVEIWLPSGELGEVGIPDFGQFIADSSQSSGEITVDTNDIMSAKPGAYTHSRQLKDNPLIKRALG